jgi:hypothetical protein
MAGGKLSTGEIIKIYLSPSIFSEEEAKNLLREMGSNIDHLENKFEKFQRKLNGMLEIKKGEERKIKFQKISEQLNSYSGTGNEITDYSVAARKNKDTNAETASDEKDKILLDRLTKEFGKEKK